MVTREQAKRVIKKEYSVLKKPYISPIQLFFLILSLIHDILIAKNWYNMLTAITITLMIIFTGISRSEAKELLLRIKTIFQDPKKTLQKKICFICKELKTLHLV